MSYNYLNTPSEYLPYHPDNPGVVHQYRTRNGFEDRTVCGLTLTWVRSVIMLGEDDHDCPDCWALGVVEPTRRKFNKYELRSG